jgi:hexokinase
VLLEEDSDLFLGQARVNAGDEEVGALVDVAGVATTRASTLSAIAVAAAVLTRRGNVTGGMSVGCRGRLREAESAYRSRPL